MDGRLSWSEVTPSGNVVARTPECCCSTVCVRLVFGTDRKILETLKRLSQRWSRELTCEGHPRAAVEVLTSRVCVCSLGVVQNVYKGRDSSHVMFFVESNVVFIQDTSSCSVFVMNNIIIFCT